ncbi:uncharacterized protein EAE97_001580 [Botrytis byssoidea]|uniref:DUF218 domain-containing protein n=1 Tax=Botrytis byssoidea TaxID=139641 RepID=A0A9P5M918_9HELO|nr:uncharacterized protein EAE97_001580 [Botrytis byssoidea]KAF7952083.1 hypothetical protein EAE97_001580 [Botrytis byssoidea]
MHSTPNPTSKPTHLILLTCHAIYVSGPPELESSWLLAPFQKEGHEWMTFIKHILRAAGLWKEDESSLLVISGGCTRGEVERSEAMGYFEVGVERGVWGRGDLVTEVRRGRGEGRIFLEEEALDSYENLVRGLLAFWRGTGEWPRRISIVSHGFKRERFEELHCGVLGLGMGMGICLKGERGVEDDGDEDADGMGGKGKGKGVEVIFEGINPEFMDEESREFDREKCEDTVKGERERGYGEWKRDLWGTGSVLRMKRGGRDKWGIKGEERKLFESEEERVKSGLSTRWLEEGEGVRREEVIKDGEGVRREEVIKEGGVLPWNC